MKIVSIAISKKKGTRKVQVDEASLIQDYGLEGMLTPGHGDQSNSGKCYIEFG
jgi:hypothetical protein